MTEQDNGGPAFPKSYIGDDIPHDGGGNGMTLRDYFAARAMQGMAASPLFQGFQDCVLARDAYELADAMLAARSPPNA